MNFVSGNCAALCDKHWMTGVLVKTLRNICSLLQIKFLVMVNLFISRPSHKPFPRTLEKSSGERSLILRLKGTKYNILLTSLSLWKLFLFCTAWKRFVINGNTHNFVHFALLEQMQLTVPIYLDYCSRYSELSSLLQQMFITPQWKFSCTDTTCYLNPRFLKFKCHTCVLCSVTFSLFM